MRILRWLGIALAAVIGLLIVVAIAARFSDGPIGGVAGGPLEAGEWVKERDVDWTFAKDVNTIEFQLAEPPRSRTLWIVVHEGQLYITCGFLNVPLWKQWPHEALEDVRAVLRVEGKLYERQAVRIDDPELHEKVTTLLGEKYMGRTGPAPTPDDLWVFRIDPRPET